MRSFAGPGWIAKLCASPKSVTKSRSLPPREIVILAKSRVSAQRVLDLILDCHRLVMGEPPEFEDSMKVYRTQKEINARLGQVCWFQTDSFPLACWVATKISRKLTLTFALALYRVSQTLHANAWMDLEPRQYPYEHRSPFARDQIRFAYAIIAAYAVFEQLGLSLNGTAFANNAWIPSKRKDLELRLAGVGIQPTETALWMIRGRRGALETKRNVPIAYGSPWSVGLIRDGEILFPDAIARARYLRSGVSAHRVDRHTRSLSVHDVANVQLLARTVLLRAIGCHPQRMNEIRLKCFQ